MKRKFDNYGGSPDYTPTPPQARVLRRFKEARQLPAQPDFWPRHDRQPLQALVRRGFLRFLIGPTGNHYVRTMKSFAGSKS